MVCTTRTPNIRPIAQRATWYTDHASHDTTCLHTRKCTKFRRLSHYLIRWVQKADLQPMVCTTRTPNIGPIVQRDTWYMDHVHDTLV